MDRHFQDACPIKRPAFCRDQHIAGDGVCGVRPIIKIHTACFSALPWAYRIPPPIFQGGVAYTYASQTISLAKCRQNFHGYAPHLCPGRNQRQRRLHRAIGGGDTGGGGDEQGPGMDTRERGNTPIGEPRLEGARADG